MKNELLEEWVKFLRGQAYVETYEPFKRKFIDIAGLIEQIDVMVADGTIPLAGTDTDE